jgi:hypothetical protein
LLGKSLRILDTRMQPIADAVAVQAGGRLGQSDASGAIRVRLHRGSGEVSFLAKGHDMATRDVEALLSAESVVLRDATGVDLVLTGLPAEVELGALSFSLEGAGLHPVALAVPTVVAEIYGLRVHNAEISDMGATATFRIPESPPSARIAVGGVYQLLQDAAPGRFLLYDVFGEVAAESSFEWRAATLASVNIDLSGAFRWFEGQIVDAVTGLPICSAEVSVGGGTAHPARTDDNGQFRLHAAASSADYVLVAAGYLTRFAPTREKLIHMLRARDVEVQVTNAAGTRIDVGIELCHGSNAWTGTRRSIGCYSFEGIPAAALNAKLTWQGNVYSLPVEPNRSAVTLTIK